MGVVETVLGIALLVMSLFLVAAVLMQSGKDKNLSGSIAGGAETFFGKQKGNTIDKKLNVATLIVAIAFTVVAIAMYLLA